MSRVVALVCLASGSGAAAEPLSPTPSAPVESDKERLVRMLREIIERQLDIDRAIRDGASP